MNYHRLPLNERFTIDLITENANMVRNAISSSDKTRENKQDELDLLRESTKKQISNILFK